MIKRIFFYSLALFSINISAQESVVKNDADSNTVIVHKDPRLDLLIKKQIQINEETTRNARKIAKGYRLLVINTNKREEALTAKSIAYSNFPELKVYLIYQSPYFKVKVGNFKERKEAEDYQRRLKAFFPKGVFIMNDIIEVNPEYEQN